MLCANFAITFCLSLDPTLLSPAPTLANGVCTDAYMWTRARVLHVLVQLDVTA